MRATGHEIDTRIAACPALATATPPVDVPLEGVPDDESGPYGDDAYTCEMATNYPVPAFDLYTALLSSSERTAATAREGW